MAVINMDYNQLFLSIFVMMSFYSSCDAIKCFHCNSANNSACLDLHLRKMNAIIPMVDCERSMPGSVSKQFFCRKITQTILYPEKTPEVRITRGCGWMKHKRECYTNDDKDHLEIVCQCFGDLCNGAAELTSPAAVTSVGVAAILVSVRSLRH